MSRAFAAVEKVSKSGDIIPPTRSICQRTAIASKATAMTNSGIETRREVVTVTDLSSKLPRRLADHTPSGTEIIQVNSKAVTVSNSVFFARLHKRGATGVL